MQIIISSELADSKRLTLKIKNVKTNNQHKF